MANYLIKESTLKSIANDVRTMQGSTASMTASEMATQLGTVKNGVGNKIDTQTDLIAQIQSALEGKAAGGGGSGGSNEIETGTVKVVNGTLMGTTISNIYYSYLDDSGNIISSFVNANNKTVTLENVILNSVIVITAYGSTMDVDVAVGHGQGTVYSNIDGNSTIHIYIPKAISSAYGYASVSIQ